MKLDITIATYNSEKTIIKCLDHIISAFAQTVLHSIVIVDNQSTDTTPSLIKDYQKKYPFIRLISHKGLLGSVRYRQAQECSTEYIVFVDSDVYLRPDWWTVVSSSFSSGDGWILGALHVPFPSYFIDYFYWLLKKTGAIAFSNTLVHRPTMLLCKELQQIHLGEDALVYSKIKESGLPVRFIDKFIADHEPVLLSGLIQRNLRAGQSVRIHRGFLYGLSIGIKSIFYDGKNYFFYCLTKKRFALFLGFILIFLRIMFLLGLVRKKIIRSA